jgi:hypothetical protein
VLEAYRLQCEAVEALGGRILLGQSRALAAAAKGPEDYRAVYGKLLTEVREPVILDWAGKSWDAGFAGYWGSEELAEAAEAFMRLVEDHADMIDGIRIALDAPQLTLALRRRLPAGVVLYTGDEANFLDLVAGTEGGHCHAMLGVLGGIAPLAAGALAELSKGNSERFKNLLAPAVPLARHMFRPPARGGAADLCFLAYLDGRQKHFVMLGGMDSARDTLHMAELFKLADRARLFADPPLAAARMKAWLGVRGVSG